MSNWTDSVACGILKFRKSDESGDLLCEYANEEAKKILGESIGKTWAEISGAYTLPLHFQDEVLSLPDGRFFKIVKKESDPDNFVFTLLDISSESRTSKEMEDFLFIASHDLQEPLRKVISFSDRIARNKESLGEENNLYFSRLMSATTRMQKMLNGLLALSRVGQTAPNFTDTDLAEVVEEAFQAASRQFQQPNAKIVVEKLPVVKAMRPQIVQLFEEIFTNSMRFQVPDKVTEIHVCSEVDLLNRQVKIRVADNGIGFDIEHADRIFLLFHRLNGRTDFEGSGIGLAICKKIAEKHGGYIKAFSTTGKGTTIEIILPLTPELARR